jgi:membrane protease YdiL (CAAX protease family)
MNGLPPPLGPPVDTTVAYVRPVAGVRPTFDERSPHPTLPIQAALGAMGVLTASLLASKYVLDALLRFDWPVVVYVVLLAMIGYGPSLVWCAAASRRWATGHTAHDLGLTPRWSDLGWGPVIWLAAVGTQLAVGAIVLVLDVPISSNTERINELQADRTYVVTLVITAVIAAPLVEELVFRGVVLRGLLSRIPAVGAIALQALLFGVAHVDPVRGVGNVGLVFVLSGVGAAFGGAAYLLRRIGPTVVAHAIFNGVVLLIVLSGVADDLRDDSAGISVVEQRLVVDQADLAEPYGSRNPR